MNLATRSMRSRTELMFHVVRVSFTGIRDQESGIINQGSKSDYVLARKQPSDDP
jgi:hypothetical protein